MLGLKAPARTPPHSGRECRLSYVLRAAKSVPAPLKGQAMREGRQVAEVFSSNPKTTCRRSRASHDDADHGRLDAEKSFVKCPMMIPAQHHAIP